MDYASALEWAGGNASELARRLGLPLTTVHSWRARGIPVGRQYQLETVSNRALRVDPEHVRPRIPANA